MLANAVVMGCHPARRRGRACPVETKNTVRLGRRAMLAAALGGVAAAAGALAEAITHADC